MSKDKLRVRIGANYNQQEHIVCNVNDDFNPVYINSEHISARICMRVNEFKGVWSSYPQEPSEPIPTTSEYFKNKRRCFSIQIQCRFHQDWTADDLYFGIVLDKKLALPVGSDMALRIAQVIDPGLKADIHSETPWTMSPLLCAMNILKISDPPVASMNADDELKDSGTLKLPEWKYGGEAQVDEFSGLKNAYGKDMSAENRKKHFLKETNRKLFKFRRENVYEFDFYNKYLDLGNLKIKLPGFSIGMLEYWNGFSIRYVCRSKDASVVFFVIELDLV